MHHTKHKAFTLVELIVVITILAILGTIAFISLQGFALDARDTKRLNDIKIIEKGLAFHKTKGEAYPLPDDAITITASGTIISYQGSVGTGVLRTISQAGEILDPSLNEPYTYALTEDKRNIQLMGYFEKEELLSFNVNNTFVGISKTHAVSHADLFPRVFGDSVGIMINPATNQSINILTTGSIDLSTNTGTYKTIFSNNITITGSGSTILTSKTIYDTSLSHPDDSLLFYFPFDKSEILDLSSNSLTGSLSGKSIIEGGRGLESLLLDGSDDTYLNLGLSSNLLDPIDSFSISVWTKLDTILGFTNNDYYILGNHSFDSMGFTVSIVDISLPTVSGRIRLTTSIPGDRSMTLATNNSYPNDNNWHHLVFVKDGIEGKIYINGSELGNYIIDDDMLGPGNSTNGLAIGAPRPSNSGLFPGNIDDVRMYSKALISEEILVIYTKEKRN